MATIINTLHESDMSKVIRIKSTGNKAQFKVFDKRTGNSIFACRRAALQKASQIDSGELKTLRQTSPIYN